MWNITSFCTFIEKHYGECKVQLDSNGFNMFKMNYSTHVQMLIVQEMYMNFLYVITCVLINYDKWV
jgi:hypothetical protein